MEVRRHLHDCQRGFYVGREEFDLRHDEVFRGVFDAATLSLKSRTFALSAARIAILAGEVVNEMRAAPAYKARMRPLIGVLAGARLSVTKKVS
jgi:hypothetical protein